MVSKGIEKANQLYQNRAERAKELRREGKKIVGYLCPFVPVEILTAGGLIPYRIAGDASEPTTRSDAYLESIFCSYLRSCFDLAIRGEYDFLDGIIMSHTCDHSVHLYNVWRHNLKPRYSHFLNVPHTLSLPSHKFFKAELGIFKRSIETLIEREIPFEQLNNAIQAHNENRALVRELYSLRKPEPPLLSGTAMMKILGAISVLPVEEANELLREVILEVKDHKDGPQKKPARLLIYGAGLDNTTFVELVEETGANVVIDSICIGTTTYWHDVETSGDPLDNIAARYLSKIPCPRTYRERTGTYQEDLENRFGYLNDFAKEFKVNGVVIYIIRYCDTFEFDLPDVMHYLEDSGLSTFIIEEDYILGRMGAVKTRIQAFLEILTNSATLQKK